MVSALNSGASAPGSSPSLGHCVVFLGKTLYSHGASLHTNQVAHQAGAYPGFRSIKRLGVFLLPLDGMPVHRRFIPSIKFAGTHLYTWVDPDFNLPDSVVLSRKREYKNKREKSANTLFLCESRIYFDGRPHRP